eukprot:CAMPEP_0172554710 /NCGR_PEP_ID=MMETSP1067-20121228/56111_1 /TAXON_ID=265564 ORGANISM="Thalassiosira punctigera, Strain Tpunct2005C2" /NCGR_SAMPLE_ID=MMETSP1067 /ASSEMBLY_ACC=CAM_ASM_000444 /LENGTH=112 /DNA_ID=CAMNT_0013343135 /DNA_START=55 /DNA_END=389 /DNA_ORIENTATION=-
MNDFSAYCRPVGSSSTLPRMGDGVSPGKKRDASSAYVGGGGGDDNDGDGDNNIGGKAELKRRCIDYHTPAVLDLTSRLYRKPNRRIHALPGGSGSAGYPFLQCHTNYLRWMG